MRTFTFTELQIIDICVASIKQSDAICTNNYFLQVKDHLLKYGIRLELLIDLRLFSTDFFIKSTEQIKEQVPELIPEIEKYISTTGLNLASVPKEWK